MLIAHKSVTGPSPDCVKMGKKPPPPEPVRKPDDLPSRRALPPEKHTDTINPGRNRLGPIVKLALGTILILYLFLFSVLILRMVGS